MDKRQRNYSLFVETRTRSDLPINVKLPFSIEFDISRNYYTSMNSAVIRVFNLSEKNRNNLRKDVMSLETFRKINLFAGYGENLVEILKGQLTQCWSARIGEDYITELTAFDYSLATVDSVSNIQYRKGTPQQSIIDSLLADLKKNGITIGSIGKVEGNTQRGGQYSGNTLDILRELTGGTIFVDNGTAHILGNNECTDDQVLIVNKDTGLLDTPRLEEYIVHCDLVFEPKIKVGQRILLESLTGNQFNTAQNVPGQNSSKNVLYRVSGIHHKGMISDSVASTATTSLDLVSGAFDPVRRSAN